MIQVDFRVFLRGEKKRLLDASGPLHAHWQWWHLAGFSQFLILECHKIILPPWRYSKFCLHYNGSPSHWVAWAARVLLHFDACLILLEAVYLFLKARSNSFSGNFRALQAQWNALFQSCVEDFRKSVLKIIEINGSLRAFSCILFLIHSGFEFSNYPREVLFQLIKEIRALVWCTLSSSF